MFQEVPAVWVGVMRAYGATRCWYRSSSVSGRFESMQLARLIDIVDDQTRQTGRLYRGKERRLYLARARTGHLR